MVKELIQDKNTGNELHYGTNKILIFIAVI